MADDDIARDAPTQSFAVLSSSKRSIIAKLHNPRPVNVQELARLTIRVRPKRPMRELETAVADIYARPARERIYLTREELEERHGASAEDLDAVTSFAEKNGLTVGRRRPAERTIVLKGKLENLLRAFPADISQCQSGRLSYWGRQGMIQVPLELADVITGVFGYETRPKQRAQRSGSSSARAGVDVSAGVAATEYAKRYNFPNSHNGTMLDGSQCCIGCVELDGSFRADDLEAYCRAIGTAVPQVFCAPPERSVAPGTMVGAGDGEVMLDVEIAAAIAPAASIAIYFGDNQSSGLLEAVSAAVHDNARKPNVLSISWGGPECLLDSQTQQAFCEIFTAARSLGMVVCAASGDHGVADLDAVHFEGALSVDHPAADPHVLACGGTQIDPHNGADVVWNDGTPFDISAQSGGWASGGGISVKQPVPDYQGSVTLPANLDGSGTAGRGLPDIAMIAVDHLTVLGGAQISSRGTSAVAPLMAGLVARLTQALGKNIGSLNGLLYGTSGLCNAVLAGDNGIAGNPAGYRAGPGPGWNACTGLGTPNGAAILQALMAEGAS